MAYDFLVPVSEKVLAFTELLPPQSLGKNIFKHTAQKGMPVFANATVAILGVLEHRTPYNRRTDKLDLDAQRLQLYRLMMGNWNTTIIDIGDVHEGERIEDTYFVVREIVAGLLEERIIPLVLGATQDITFPTYRGFDNIRDMISIVQIDSRFDFGEEDELIGTQSYMSKIITDKPNNLYHFTNIGYQSYFNAQEEIDLMERLFFETYRLGDVTHDIRSAEPLLRNADLISLDMHAVRAQEVGRDQDFSPNGFTGREICALARYAGISDKVFLFGIYELENTSLSQQLVAQMIWYFLEGLSLRIEEKPSEENEDFVKFTVPTETEDLIFYKSHLTSRWWLEAPALVPADTKKPSVTLLPCTEDDYLAACNQDIPERWYKAYKKGFN